VEEDTWHAPVTLSEVQTQGQALWDLYENNLLFFIYWRYYEVIQLVRKKIPRSATIPGNTLSRSPHYSLLHRRPRSTLLHL